MNHYKKHHGGFPPGFDDLKKYPCELCPDQVFLWPKGLAQHRQIFVPSIGNIESFVQMAQRLERTSMSASAPKTSPRSNPFATYVKERLLPSTKNTVTELWVIEFVS